MLRVRETRGPVRDDGAAGEGLVDRQRLLRLSAMAACGIAIGAGCAIFGVSLVQAEDAGIREVQRLDAAARRHDRPAAQRASAYAPFRDLRALPLAATGSDGRIGHPPIALNPFRRVQPPPGRAQDAPRAAALAVAAAGTRTICVRLCDGFHAPLGLLRKSSDWNVHEQLCQAMNPGLPVRVFRLGAAAHDIGAARSADGRRYRELPTAFRHEKSGDAACRPAIVREGEGRVSLLRDITLRPGDSVVLDGKVKTFAGSAHWPYRASDFRDFRSAAELSRSQRRDIDERVGISRLEAQQRSVERRMRRREASLAEAGIASDATFLRGTIEPARRGEVRVIGLPAYR